MSSTQTKPVAFRLPQALLDRLDVVVGKMSKEKVGLRVTRADVVRVLLERALPFYEEL